MTVYFVTPGLIPLESFTTFGVNAKIHDNPIGRFGTGLKYTVAVVLRLGGTMRLWRGSEEYEFYIKESDFRGKTFDFVRMRRRKRFYDKWSYSKLPFTTELGKDWKAWQAVRELESNTRDEQGYSTDGLVTVREAQTIIEIKCPEFEHEWINLERIFLNRDGPSLLHADETVEIFDEPSNAIFFRGLRVTDLRQESMFTYNLLQNVTLTEDRTSKTPYMDDVYIRKSLSRTTNEKILRRLMSMPKDCHEATLDFDVTWNEPSTHFYTAARSHVSSGGVLPSRIGTFMTAKERKKTGADGIDVHLSGAQWVQVAIVLKAHGKSEGLEGVHQVIIDAMREHYGEDWDWSGGEPGALRAEDEDPDLSPEPAPEAEDDRVPF